MVATIKTTLSIQKALYDQAETLAQQLNISQSQLLEAVIEDFVKNYQSHCLDEIDKQDQANPNKQAEQPHQHTETAAQIRSGIKQGDIYWAQIDEPNSSEPGYPHPHVVIQDNVFNRSRINTVVVCALTSNIKRANEPGNVLLDIGEANLSRQSVVVISQISTVDEAQLGEYIGELSMQRINQILSGMRFQQLSFFTR